MSRNYNRVIGDTVMRSQLKSFIITLNLPITISADWALSWLQDFTDRLTVGTYLEAHCDEKLARDRKRNGHPGGRAADGSGSDAGQPGSEQKHHQRNPPAGPDDGEDGHDDGREFD